MVEAYKQKNPYPVALVCYRSKDKMREFVQIFGQLKTNLPLCDVLSQVPKYAKLVKEMLSRMKNINNVAVFTLGKHFSEISISKEKLPQKLNDPRSFSIPCVVGGFTLITP